MSVKFSIQSAAFAGALRQVQSTAPGRGAVTIIQNVLIEADAEAGQIALTTTDLEITVRTVVAANVEVGGATTLSVEQLARMVAKVGDATLEFDVDDSDRAVIKAGRRATRLTGLAAVDFPQVPKGEDDAFEYVVPQIVLREMFRKTAYAASKEMERKTLAGVLMAFENGMLTLVATDGRRIAKVEHEVEFPQSAAREIVLPQKVVGEIQKLLGSEGEVRIKAETNRVVFTLGGTMVWSKLVADVYPNYKAVIPTNLGEAVAFNREELIKSLEYVSALVVNDASSVRLTVGENEAVLSSNIRSSDASEAKDEIEVKYSGVPVVINFKPEYLLQALKVIDDDEVQLAFTDTFRAARLTCSVPFIYVFMALRMD